MSNNLKKFLKKERKIWHVHFVPSIIAGVAVGILSFLYNATISNIVLFASVGASAVILANSRSHHLMKLRTTIIAYIIAAVISTLIFLFAENIFRIDISINIAVTVFLISVLLYLLDAFHPPAITAALSFSILERPPLDLLLLFIAIIILFIIIRLMAYIFSQHLSLKKFFQEFSKNVV